MKKITAWLAASLIVAWISFARVTALAAAPQPAAPAEQTPAILLDGLPLPFTVPPMIAQGRTMVPFRAIAEALGVAVEWHAQTQTITANGPGRTVTLTINDARALANGQPVTLDVPPMIVQGRTLVPLRFFSEAFGATVGWNGVTSTVSLTSPQRPLRTLAFYAIRSFDERLMAMRFSDVAYGWATLTAGGAVDLVGDQDYRWPEPYGEISGERLMADVKLFGARRHLMIHARDEKGDFTRLVQDSALIAKVAREVATVVAEKGFDGVVLDIEYLGQTEQGEELERIRSGFVSLVRAVAAQMRAGGRETIVSVHPLNGAFHGYDYAALAQEADLLQVMAHDFLDRRTETGPEPSEKVIESIELALAAAPAAKLLLGIVAAYETPETMAQKVGLAKRYSLSGLSVWRLGAVGEERLQALEALVMPRRQD